MLGTIVSRDFFEKKKVFFFIILTKFSWKNKKNIISLLVSVLNLPIASKVLSIRLSMPGKNPVDETLIIFLLIFSENRS